MSVGEASWGHLLKDGEQNRTGWRRGRTASRVIFRVVLTQGRGACDLQPLLWPVTGCGLAQGTVSHTILGETAASVGGKSSEQLRPAPQRLGSAAGTEHSAFDLSLPALYILMDAGPSVE